MENLDQNTQNQTGLDPAMEQASAVSNQAATTIDPVVPPQGGLQERLNQQASGSKKGGAKLWLLIVAVLVLVLIGVAGWWYYAQGQAMLLARDIKWDWGQNLKNFKSDINIDLDIKNIKDNSGGLALFGAPSSFKINVSNEMHNVDKDFQGSGDFSVFAGGMGIDLSLEYKKIGETFYIKPDPQSLDIPLLPVDPNILEGRWLYFSQSDWDDFSGGSSDEKDQANEQQMQQKNEQFLKALKDKKAFTITDPHETRDSASGKLKKLQFVIKKDRVEEVIITGMNIYSDDPEKEIEDMNKEKAENPEEWEKFKNFIANVQMMVWVNTKTKVIQGAEFAMDNLEYASSDSSATIDGNISFLIEAEEPVVISTPVNAITFEELMMEIMEAEMDMPAETIVEFDGSLDSDGDGLDDMTEGAIGTDPNDEDSDDDGYSDGVEIVNGYNPMGEGTIEDYEKILMPKIEASCVATGGIWLEEEEDCLCGEDDQVFLGLKEGCVKGNISDL